MTTYFPFQPTAAAPYEFKPTLDGVQYQCTVTWNLAGQRWYLNIFDLQGNLQLTKALISSPNDYDIDLVEFYFTSTLVFRDSTQQFEVNP